MVPGEPEGGTARVEPLYIEDAEGVHAIVEAELTDPARIRARLADGRRVEVPLEVLEATPRGWRAPLSFASLGDGEGGEHIVPLAEERVVTGRRRRRTGVVRVHTWVREHEAIVDEPVRVEEVEVSHVPIGRYVESAAPVREEGDTLVIPVHEEVLVVERRLLLKEEVHVRKSAREERHHQAVTLRREDIEVERRPASGASAPTDKP